jgi:hypothetical protein
MRMLTSGFLLFIFAAASIVTSTATAVTYQVDRFFSEGASNVTLTGVVSVPLGNYVIQNAIPNPFTAIKLSMTVDAASYSLTNALTHLIFGTGQFIVDATPTKLVFRTANADGLNPADLLFSDPANNYYGIGSDEDPAFEAASTSTHFAAAAVDFPVVFGTAIPEPSSITLFALATLGFGLRRRRYISK